jgi:DNA-binding beta-propeller fold protein YncE
MRFVTRFVPVLLLLATLVNPSSTRAAACPGPIGGWGIPGAGPSQFNLPNSLVRDPSGRWLVTDQLNNRVQIFDPTGGYLGQFGTLGSGSGQLFHPCGIAIGFNHLVYVAEHQNHRISVFSLAGGFIRTMGSFGVGPGQLEYPVAVDIDAYGNLYVADSENYRIVRFSPEGNGFASFGVGFRPYGVRVAPDGTIWVMEYGGSLIRRYDPDGAPLGTWAGNGDFYGPEAVTFDRRGNVFVVDTGNDRIQLFDPSLNFVCSFGSTGTGDANLDVPTDLEVDAFGQIVIADYANNRIRVWGLQPTPVARSTWGSLKLRYR